MVTAHSNAHPALCAPADASRAIAICQRSGHWVITSTDGQQLFTRRTYQRPTQALAAACRLLEKPGHVVAFPNAYRALTDAATGRIGGAR